MNYFSRRRGRIGPLILVLGVLALFGLTAYGGDFSLHQFGSGLLLFGSGTIDLSETEVRNTVLAIRDNVKGMEGRARDYAEQLKELKQHNQELRTQIDTLRKAGLRATSATQGGGVDIARGRFVSDECAKYLASIVILGADRLGKLTHLKGSDAEELIKRSLDTIGMTVEQKASLTTTDIPLPVTYGSEVVELVWMWGQARRYGTVYPLGKGGAKLPKLKTSPAFGFIDIAAAVPEKSPQIEFVTFAPEKAGGLIRIPTEIDEDSIVALGQFVARYVARELAKWEDIVFFTADGTATYKTMKGIGKAAVDLNKKLQLATGNTSTNSITLQNLRDLRAKIDTAALGTAAYYFHMSMESKLSSFNTSGDKPYIANGANGPTLDGYPIRWVECLPVLSTTATVNAVAALFGDATYQYLGTRSEIRIETSKEVYFATDEIAIRALERFCVNLMNDNANAALQLAAS
jgi:HK97 family phage major capsid protein